ncbi:MAG: vWA domain-containing protein [Chloroflexota bacterium]
MSYTAAANRKNPALIIYLLDCSGSMATQDVKLNDGSTETRMNVVLKAFEESVIRMIQLSTKGTVISPRYRLAVYAYTSDVQDVFGGIKTIDQVAQIGLPTLTAQTQTNTEAAFLRAEELLRAELPKLSVGVPAPLICHMTDGEVNMGGDASIVAQRIMRMNVPDGNVLIENIFVSPSAQLLRDTAIDAKSWPGISSPTELINDYAKRLFEMSSAVPDSYRSMMLEMGYKGLQLGARMMFAGNDYPLIKMAFAMSTATPVR